MVSQNIDLSSTGLRRSHRFSNKPKQKYGIFDKLSLALVGACEEHFKNTYF